jgi:hypothetical protein
VPARDALYRQIRHACAQGIDRVIVVEEASARRGEFRVVSH